MTRLLDRRFKYRRACETDVRETWKRHGFKPTTAAQREAQQQRPEPTPAPAPPRRTRKTRAQQWPTPTQLRAVSGGK